MVAGTSSNPLVGSNRSNDSMAATGNAPAKDNGKPEDDLPIRPGEFVRGIQRFVTVARKAEIRVRKAQEEREAILGRWDKFQNELQATFVKERELFKKDLQRNQEELNKLDEAQRGAFEDLQKAFSSPATMKSKPAAQPNQDALQEWQSVLEACEEEPDVEMTAAMAEALGAHDDLEAKTPARRGTPRMETMTPPRPTASRAGPKSSKAWDAFMEAASGFARRNKEGRGTDSFEDKIQDTANPYQVNGGEISDEEDDEVMVGALGRKEEIPEADSSWHGPLGGHVRVWSSHWSGNGRHAEWPGLRRCWSILDVLEFIYEFAEVTFWAGEAGSSHLVAFFSTLLAVYTIALVLVGPNRMIRVFLLFAVSYQAPPPRFAVPVATEQMDDLQPTMEEEGHSFDQFYATTPQIGDHFASFIACPPWMGETSKTMLVMDAREIGGTVFAFYVDDEISLQTVKNNLLEFEASQPDVYLFGNHRPLQPGQLARPITAGVVKVVLRGAICRWSDELTTRLRQVDRWLPNLDPPGARDGLFEVFQSTDDQVIEDLIEDDERPIEQAAAEMLMVDYPCVVYLPEERIAKLAHEGRRIWEIYAVLNLNELPGEDTFVIFLDLQQLGLFPQWAQLTTADFDPREYVSGLQLQGIQDWVITVIGGQPQRNGQLVVKNCETLVITLQPPEETSEENESGDEESDDDDSDSGDDSSRVPLAELLPPPAFDIDCETIPLQHGAEEVSQMVAVWPPDWLQASLDDIDFKPVTRQALSLAALVHWTTILCGTAQLSNLAVHIYTDGSYAEEQGISGAAALMLLRDDNSRIAWLGGCGTKILGDPDSLWTGSYPPALYAEQVAIVLALLWIGQALHFMPIGEVVVHFDCQAAGWSADGSWAPCNSFATKVHELELFIRSLLAGRLTFQHVKAHEGDAWNEAADVMAKTVSGCPRMIPSPPARNCQAFLYADLSWLATTVWPGGRGVLPIKHGSFLQWKPGEHRRSFFQETKDAEGTVSSRRFLRLASPSQAHWGTAIWFSKTLGAFEVEGKTMIIEEADLVIVQSTPRLLLVSIDKDGFKCLLFSGYCPHEARADERQQFLSELARRLRQLPPHDLVIGGIDANARPPLGYAEVTGTRPFSQPDFAGQEFAATLHDCNLWLPATFHEYHHGIDATYQHPNGQEHRIDFIALGGQALANQVESQVALDFDTANKLEDHKAVELTLAFTVGGLHGERKLYRPRFDRQRMRSREGHGDYPRGYDQVPGTTMVCGCGQALPATAGLPPATDGGQMEDNFRAPSGGFRATYISSEVWSWREAKLKLKELAGHRRRMWPTAVAEAFSWWAGSSDTWSPRAVLKQELLYDLVAAAITFATDRIKRRIYKDKQTFLEQLAHDGLSSTTQILQRLRQHGLGGRKNKVQKKPLPKLCRQVPWTTADLPTRSLFVSSTLGKAYHKLIRGRGAPIGFASMYPLSFLRHAQDRHHSCAALFIDTRAAYYRVVRQVAIGTLQADEDVARLLSYFGLGPDDMHQLLRIVQEGGLMKEAGNKESVQAACADFHRGTWFVSSYATGHKLATTTTGSRPGDSWADAIFAYIYARAMGTLVERADGESLLSYIEHNPDNGIFSGPVGEVASIARDGTWADDSVLPIEDKSPGQLVAKLKRLASLAISTLEEFGLSPNLKPGKTSAVLSLVGKGAMAARRAATIQGRPAILLEDLGIELPIVPQHVHLGAVIDNKLTLKGESRHRLALLGSAYDQGKRLVFQNKTIPLAIRASLFETGVRSTLFNLSIWMPEGEAWSKLSGGYSRCLRRLLSTHYKGADLFKIPLPMVHVLTDSWSLDLVAMRSRLGLLAALVTNGPDILWAVLQQEQRWMSQLQVDLQRLRTFDSECLEPDTNRQMIGPAEWAACDLNPKVGWEGWEPTSSRPGFGSREWRRLETEQYTPAASAYRAVCGELFEAHSWSDTDGLVSAIVGILSSIPLYASEECDVCDYIAGEVRELRGSDPQLLCDEKSTENVLQALETAPSSPRAPTTECCERSNTLQDFKAEIAAIQWEKIVRGCSFECETPEATPEILEISWEDGGHDVARVAEVPNSRIAAEAYLVFLKECHGVSDGSGAGDSCAADAGYDDEHRRHYVDPSNIGLVEKKQLCTVR
ncbi:hypothetical protein AK812_SmicGene11060 [Symbiodinium microadriaticum]|uniref:Uncharacterized protein n=1 Tax=Symbiodinium microadriaticum TaxID=2951 RepID=A0A1Q9EE38_SYMMI|nr:hypothetical protein AK812_SmicGene11060 [Symbiodinium microadriaticum]CAE7247342.1 unnamed protein product [Symbiodinium microadriaticum]